MATPYEHIPDDVKRQTLGADARKTARPSPAPTEPIRAGLFKKKRAGVPLSRDEAKEIKQRRKALRKELRQRGVRDKQTFELYAGAEGAYFDKASGLLSWLFHGRALWALLGASGLVLAAFLAMSLVSQMRGYFTINMSDEMFKDGFILSETKDFTKPAVNLTCEPAVDVPCISISQIADDVNEIDGPHNSNYFAYTFYLRNEGENTVDYVWDVELTDEAQNLSKATWVMVFEDGRMRFFAKPNDATGGKEALPSFGDNTKGYLDPKLREYALHPDEQYQVVAQKDDRTYYRLIPYEFEGESVVATGQQASVAPMDVHKYCVVIWMEGDDPSCNDDLRDGHLGLAMQFRLVDESDEDGRAATESWWSRAWRSLGQ